MANERPDGKGGSNKPQQQHKKKQQGGGRGRGGGRGGGGRGGGAKKSAPRNGKQRATPNDSKTKQKTAPHRPAAGDKDKEKYVVIVTNAENNLPAIHAQQLAYHFGLNRKYEQSSSKSQPRQPRYAIKVREETRSAKISFTYSNEEEAKELFSGNVNEEGGNRRGDITSAAEALKALPPQYFGETLSCASAELPSVVQEESVDVVEPGMDQHVSTEVSTPMPLGEKQLSKLLRDIPGFLHAWKLGQKRFRVVFNSVKKLYAAKTLLDAFEADGIRISVSLPDNLESEYNEYLEKQAEE